MYNPQIGTFLQRDPIGYIPGPNLYQYVNSNPVIATDPLGLTPNRQDAITLDRLIKFVEQLERQYPDEDCCKILVRVRDAIKGDRKISGSGGSVGSGQSAPSGSSGGSDSGVGSNAGSGASPSDSPANGNNGFPWSYIYTQDWEWIDLGHFFEAARYGKTVPKFVVEAGGGAVEYLQGLVGIFWPSAQGQGSSAFSREDWASNQEGAKFGDLLAEANCKDKLSVELRRYFERIGATAPAAAPDYRSLPATEADHEAAWQAKKAAEEARLRSTLDPRNGWPKSRAPCFPAGTLVVTARGCQPIESLGVGDVVAAVDSAKNLRVPAIITRVHKHDAESYPTIIFAIDKDECLEVTPAHPILTISGWLLAQEVIEGIGVRTGREPNMYSVVTNVRLGRTYPMVFNIETDVGNYLVGRSQVIVSGVVQDNIDSNRTLNEMVSAR